VTVKAWRLCDDRFAATIWSGIGARDHSGRWNSKGVAIAYASATRSLAAPEQLAQMVSPRVLTGYVFASITLDEVQVERLDPARLPRTWNARVVDPATRAIGDRWASAGRALALAVPSVVMPGEWNYLVNPAHPDFAVVVKSKPEPYAHDPRLA
jgi:RES domain-containing protein